MSISDAWYKKAAWLSLLRPLSGFYSLVSSVRRGLYKDSSTKVYHSKLPLIVIGNISVGGTGKTPLVIYLATKLREAGFRPGIVSRGYKSQAPAYPYRVTTTSPAHEAGDESLLLAQNTLCPVIIDAKRVQAVKLLEDEYDCNVILSDDGMQHYAMGRDIEIAVVDGLRGFGNERLLPEGPLREKPSRLAQVDYVVCNGESRYPLPTKAIQMDLKPTYLYHLKSGKRLALESSEAALAVVTKSKVHALAGIGNPERFFNSLCACGFDIITHIFKDHHEFTEQDITFDDKLDVMMTEKDAIKCLSFATDKHWYLKVEADLAPSFLESLIQQLNALAK